MIVDLIEAGLEAKEAEKAQFLVLLRLKDRQITEEDLLLLKLWRESEPDGPWYKDFGSFKICGEGEFPLTFLLCGQSAKGRRL